MELKLFPFQEKGVQFIQQKNGRAIIADQMGLGKTAQALSWLEKSRQLPAIIVVPASVKLNWLNEANMWTSYKHVYIATGRKPGLPRHSEKPSIIIINYDILQYWRSVLRDFIQPQTIILDECHYIKNWKAKRTRAVQYLAKGVPNIIALSGTPITSKPIEFYNVLNLLRPDLFKYRWAYAKRYCDAKHTQWGWDLSGHSNTKELFRLLRKNVMIRRLKKDVLPELPDKIRSVIPVEASNLKQYRKMLKDFKEWLKGTYISKDGTVKKNSQNPAKTMVQMGKVKHAIARAKIKPCVDWIKDYLSSGEKLVVYAVHQDILAFLMKALAEYNPAEISGRVSTKIKDRAEKKFMKDDECRVLVAGIGGEAKAIIGRNLTVASATCTIELVWSPSDHDQAEDRVHRIGQESDSVYAYYLLCQDTIEQDIAQLLYKKIKVLNQILDRGKEVSDQTVLDEMLVKI